MLNRETRIRQWRADGWKWADIGKALGISGTTARCIVDPEYRRIRNERTWRIRHGGDIRGIGGTKHIASHKPHPDDLAARLAEIPPDTRTLTGVICGDPLPGRSALDMRDSS